MHAVEVWPGEDRAAFECLSLGTIETGQIANRTHHSNKLAPEHVARCVRLGAKVGLTSKINAVQPSCREARPVLVAMYICEQHRQFVWLLPISFGCNARASGLIQMQRRTGLWRVRGSRLRLNQKSISQANFFFTRFSPRLMHTFQN